MSLIDLASLVLAPTATKEGKVYSAIPDTGEGDMTFTRGSAATRVNSEGLIEKERANLLLQSNSFDTTWVNTNVSVTGGQSGYDGSSDAWKVDISSSFAQVEQSISSSGVQTFSVYAKAGSLNWVRLRVDHSTFSGTYFDLQNGLVGTTASDIYSTIEDVGSGWYRCSLSYNNNITKVRIYPAQADNDLTATSGNIYIQDAMLNEGLVAQPYIETTTTAVYEGITDDVPRVDYSGGGCPSLKLEPQRSNLMVQSEAFSTSAWTDNATNTNVTANATISPEGVQNASEIEFTNTGASIFDQFTNVASSMHIGTIFLKNKDVNSIDFEVVGGAPSIAAKVTVDLVNGTLSNAIGDFTPTIEDFGNGWYRVAIGDTGTATIATPAFKFESVGGNTGSFYAYGAMVEVGNYSTSYIPTYGTSTTRVADSCSKTGISELIGQSEGTIFIQVNSNEHISELSDGTSANRIVFYTDGSDYLRNLIRASASTSSNIQTNTTIQAGDKIALTYANNDSVIYKNGVQIGSDTSVTIPATSKVSVGSDYNGSLITTNSVNEFILFKTRLTNDELAELTKL